MPRTTDWTREQTLAALHVYFQLPFGQLHQRNPQIRQLAEWIGRTPSAVALKLVNFASLDPQVRASGRAGMGHASQLDAQIWQELNRHWDAVATEAASTYERLGSEHGVAPGADVVEEVPGFAEGKSTTATVKVRVNQARFRRAVLASYNARCCISGLAVSKLLIASHIVPWSMDTKNRLNPQNGLCLSALHDKAYDIGLITVLPDYTVRVSRALKDVQLDRFTQHALTQFDGKPIAMPERFKPAADFLASHASRFGFI
ncbi:MAG: restriction endonuclease [Betaproteobacteria bacterium HGW-Betaproteobacteria-9]|jgi:predicted restriction endonuclease|nr:MAG: restriction endonuclease [Betaproteobacteria bacterium HGW-Betaproteobacteria-9]